MTTITFFIITATVIGASLSEPHTSGTALQDPCVHVCLFVYDRVAIYRKFTLNEMDTYIPNLYMC